jgi:hypothetical protein
MHEGARVTQFAPLPRQDSPPVIVWQSARDQATHALGSSGGVYRLSADTVELVAEVGLDAAVFPPHAAALGETLFVLSSGRLHRASIGSGTMETKDVGELLSEAGIVALRHMIAVSEDVLLLERMADEAAWDTEDSMSSATSRLYVLRFSEMTLTPWVEVPALAFEFSVRGGMIWLAWTEYPFGGTTVAVAPFPGE